MSLRRSPSSLGSRLMSAVSQSAMVQLLGVRLDNLAGEVPQDQVTDLPADLADRVTTADLTSTGPGKGAALPVMEDGANVRQALSIASDAPTLIAGSASAPVGSIVRTADGVAYEVQASDATDFDVENAADLKLNVLGDDFNLSSVLPSGSPDIAPYLQRALGRGYRSIRIPRGTYTCSRVIATLTNDLRLTLDEGCLIEAGAAGNGGAENNFFAIQITTGGHAIRVDGKGVIDCESICPGALRIRNDTSSYAESYVGEIEVRNVYRSAAGGGKGSRGISIEGAFDPATYDRTRAVNISRAAGSGTPGVIGTHALNVTQTTVSSVEYFPRNILCIEPYIDRVTTEDASGSANNVDCDAIRAFTQTNSATGIAVGEGNSASLVGGVFKNVRGRAWKPQSARVTITGTPKLIINDEIQIKGGASYFDCQTAARVNISGIDAVFDGSDTDPFEGGYTGFIVGLFDAISYGRPSKQANVANINVAMKSVPSGSGLLAPVAASSGYEVDRPAVANISDVIVEGEVRFLALVNGPASSPQVYNIERVSALLCAAGAIGTTVTTNTNTIVNLLNCSNFGAIKPAGVSSTDGTTRTRIKIKGSNLYGFENTAASLGSTAEASGVAPLYASTIVPSDANPAAISGAINQQSVSLADDETVVIRKMGMLPGWGVFTISGFQSMGEQGLFRAAGTTIQEVTFPGGTTSAFQIGSGSNPDVDGKINLWMSGGQLNIKNRMGGTRHHEIVWFG